MTNRENGRGQFEGLALQPEREETKRLTQPRQDLEAAARESAARHVSPDPMSRTDRYRLVTPYWDRV